jgi:hypothetical protein
MTISSPIFARLQDGIKSVDDLRVRGPLNVALAWLSGDLLTQLNAQFDAISQSASVQIHAAIVAFSNSNSVQIAGQVAAVSPIGKHKLWIPVKQMTADATTPPAAASVVATDVQYDTLDFDQTTQEEAHFNISMPSSWNEGTVSFVAVWTAAAGTGDVVWVLNGAAASNDDVIAATYSGSAARTDTLIATGDLHRSAESPALTIDGTPAANDTVFFRFYRNTGSGSDTLNDDARLIGVEIFYTTAAAVDVA